MAVVPYQSVRGYHVATKKQSSRAHSTENGAERASERASGRGGSERERGGRAVMVGPCQRQLEIECFSGFSTTPIIIGSLSMSHLF